MDAIFTMPRLRKKGDVCIVPIVERSRAVYQTNDVEVVRVSYWDEVFPVAQGLRTREALRWVQREMKGREPHADVFVARLMDGTIISRAKKG